MDNSFTPDLENILEKIRINSLILSKEHKKRYIFLKSSLKYYKIPIIVIGSLNAISSIALVPFLPQVYISLLNCLLSISCSLVTSIELFFGVTAQMENELGTSKAFYFLSTDIYKTLSLNVANRNIDGMAFLQESYSRYVKLTDSSCVLKKRIDDKLCPLPDELTGIALTSSSNTLIETSSDGSAENNSI
jgi:hypothetical protein